MHIETEEDMIPVKQLAQKLLDRMIDSHDTKYGFGTMSCSIYDTAWLSMVSKTECEATTWLFPQCFSFLLENQEVDGSWAAIASPIDSILSTAAALLSLCKHQEAAFEHAVDSSDLSQRISLAYSALGEMLQKWDIQATLHVGFEILVPALLEYLEEYNLNFEFHGRKKLCHVRDVKLSMLKLRSLEDDGPAHSILHSLEALKGRIDFDKIAQHKVHGSIMASPAATAAYLIYAKEWDLEAEAYLRHVFIHGDGHGNGSIPAAFPTTIFETTWVLSTLASGGIDKEHLGSDRVEALLGPVFEEFEQKRGLIGFATGIQPDADDTAKGVTAMNMLGYPASSTALINSFGKGEWFKTYPQERTVSISTNCNALIAMMSDHENLASHSETIINIIQYLCSVWFQSPKAMDKWNLSMYYQTMLLVQAFSRAIKLHVNGELDAEKGILEDDVPLVLLQNLVHILQGQCADGSWDHDKEITAYAMLAIGALREIPQGQLLAKEMEAAMRNGRLYLVKNISHDQPSMLWIEKVTYGSVHLADAYTLAALHSSSIDWPHQSGKVTCPQAWEKAAAMVRFYKKLPMLGDVPSWLISESVIEGLLFGGRLEKEYKRALQDPTAGGKHLRFIPFTWTVITRIVDVDLSPQIQLDMMTISALLYALDHHMEVDIGTRTITERQVVRDSVNGDFEYLEEHKCLPAAPLMDKSLCQIALFMWDHPKVQAATDADKSQLLADIRLLYLAHLDQLDENESLRNMRQAGLTGKASLKGRHSSLYEWIQTTSGHHTGGGAAFSFFLCLIASDNSVLPSPRARYIGGKLSESLRALSRIQNDYGSVERDYIECNLNSIDFLEPFAPTDQDTLGRSKEINQSISLEELSALADYERETCDRLLQGELAGLVSPSTLSALQLFAATVNVYGELYMLKDHTPRHTEQKFKPVQEVSV